MHELAETSPDRPAGETLGVGHDSRIGVAVGLLDGWRYCPRCGASATRAEENSTCTLCGYTVWAAAIPGVQGLAVSTDGCVLLGRRAREPGAGLWDIPGGFLGEREDPVVGLRREFLEETGLAIDIGPFLGIWVESYGERFVSCATWLVRPIGGVLTAGDDLEHLTWFPPTALPATADVAFPTHSEILAIWAAFK